MAAAVDGIGLERQTRLSFVHRKLVDRGARFAVVDGGAGRGRFRRWDGGGRGGAPNGARRPVAARAHRLQRRGQRRMAGRPGRHRRRREQSRLSPGRRRDRPQIGAERSAAGRFPGRAGRVHPPARRCLELGRGEAAPAHRLSGAAGRFPLLVRALRPSRGGDVRQDLRRRSSRPSLRRGRHRPDVGRPDERHHPAP